MIAEIPMKKLNWILGAVVSGVLLRISLALYLPGEPVWSDSDTYIEGALNILSGQPYDVEYKRSPLFSYFIAFIYFIFGESVYWIRLVNAFLWLIIAGIYGWIAQQLFQKQWLSSLVVVTIMLHPFLIYLSGVALSETFFILMYSLALAALYHFRTSNSWYMLGAAGACLGLTYLVRATGFVFVPIVFCWLLSMRKISIPRRLIHCLVLATLFMTVAFPFLNKLHEVNGKWVISGYGSQFLWFFTVSPLYGPIDNVIEKPADLSIEQAIKYNQYKPDVDKDTPIDIANKLYAQETRRYISDQPFEFSLKLVRRFLNNFRLTVRTNTNSGIQSAWFVKLGTALSLAPIYLLFFVGLWSSRKNDPVRFLPLLAVLLPSLAVFALYHSRVRYTLSLLPILILFAGFGLDQLVAYCKEKRIGLAAAERL